jgi:hypothetical protein
MEARDVPAARCVASDASARLACLEACGLVSREGRGRFVHSWIAHENVTIALEGAEAILAQVRDSVYRYGGSTGGQRQPGKNPLSLRERGLVLPTTNGGATIRRRRGWNS